MNKKFIIPLIAITLAGFSISGVNRVFAQGPQGNMSSIVQKIASTFGLKVNDVQAVFDQQRQERQAEMQTKFEDKLTQAVKDGKITEAQKQLILNKHKEIQDSRQKNQSTMKNLNPEERKTEMQKQRQDMENWAKQNGIDPAYFFNGFGMRGRMKGQ